MKRILRIVLQIVVVLIGVAAFALLLWEPHLEGRNANATVLEIYFKDPFLAYAYIASIPFFVGVYQAFKALGYIGQNNQAAVKSFRMIKHCALAVIGFAVGGEIFIMLGNPEEDRAGGVVIGLLIIFGSVAVAIAAAMLEKGKWRMG